MATEAYEVRQAIAAAIEALSGYTESRQPPGRLGLDTQHLLHKGFSVEVIATTAPEEQRQRPAEGVLVTSEVQIAIAYQIRGDAAVADYDAALQGEDTVRKALGNLSRTSGGPARLTYQSSSRTLAATGNYLIPTLRYQALHLAALQ